MSVLLGAVSDLIQRQHQLGIARAIQYAVPIQSVFADDVGEAGSGLIQNEIHELERQRAELIAKLNGIRHYIGVIQDEGRITGFDETLWLNTVDRLWIKPDGTMRFEFKGGPAIEG